MLRKFSSLCAFLLAVTLVASTSSAALLLQAMPTGATVLNPGDELGINISLTVTQLPYNDGVGNRTNVRWGGTDFQIFTNSDSTFEGRAATVPADDFGGGWFPAPGPGEAFAAWANAIFDNGDGDPYIQWNAVGEGAIIGNITLKAGATAGTYNVTFSDVLSLNNLFNQIPMSTAGFSYEVVPEPSSALLGGLALTGLVFRRRRSA